MALAAHLPDRATIIVLTLIAGFIDGCGNVGLLVFPASITGDLVVASTAAITGSAREDKSSHGLWRCRLCVIFVFTAAAALGSLVEFCMKRARVRARDDAALAHLPLLSPTIESAGTRAHRLLAPKAEVIMNETRNSIAMQDASARDRALSKQRSVLAVFLLSAELVLLISACIIAVARPFSMDVTPAYSPGAFMVALVLAASMGVQALCARRCIAGGDGAKFATVVQTITLIIFAETACDAASEFSDRCCSNQRTEVSQTRSNFISTSSNDDAYGRMRTGNAR
jgi:hypothetical protein